MHWAHQAAYRTPYGAVVAASREPILCYAVSVYREQCPGPWAVERARSDGGAMGSGSGCIGIGGGVRYWVVRNYISAV
jgi:hypothetical protein